MAQNLSPRSPVSWSTPDTPSHDEPVPGAFGVPAGDRSVADGESPDAVPRDFVSRPGRPV